MFSVFDAPQFDQAQDDKTQQKKLEEEKKMEEINKLKEQIIAHVKKMRVAADPNKAKCVDGGYKGDEAVGAMAIPGGHLGVSMALLRLGFTPEDAFGLVHKFVSKDQKPYCWHTDKHEGQGETIVGCGHCNAAIGKGGEYELDGDKVQSLLDIVRQAQKDQGDMECVTLDRDHIEKAILVITSAEHTVKPWDQEDNVQFFIYDKKRHIVFLQKFVEFLASKYGKTVTFKELFDASEKQTNATLGLLKSSKGKPIFEVDASSEEPVVEYVQDAPVIE